MKFQNCPICGKEFKVAGSQQRRYCSRKCLSKGYKEQFKGEKNPNYKHGLSYCDKCGNELNRGTFGRFCASCVNKSGENNAFFGKKHTAETRKVMSENHCDCNGDKNFFYGKHHSKLTKKTISGYAKERFADPVYKAKIVAALKKATAAQLQIKGNTIPERKVAEYLDTAGIKYSRNEFLYDKFFVDFFLEDKTIVEVFGDYWHANPCVFQKLNAHQEKQIKKDKARLAYLRKCGHKVVVLWERDIKEGRIVI